LSIYLYSGSLDSKVATNLGTDLPTTFQCAKSSLSVAQTFYEYKHAFIQSGTKGSPNNNCIKMERVSEF